MPKDTKSSDQRWDERDASLLLDKGSRHSLALIMGDSVEPFSYLYNMEYDRANDVEARIRAKSGLDPLPPGERVADYCISRLDDILVMSASARGQRAKQVENVLRSANGEQEPGGRDFEVQGRGLRHRDTQQSD